MPQVIFYHFPFDTGYVIGEDQRVVSGIVDQIKKHSGDIFGHVAQKKVEIIRLEAPEDYAEQSVNGKLEILGYVHKDIIDRIERNHNFEMSRAVFVLQRVGFALAAALGIMLLLMTAVRNTAPYGPVQWMYPTLVEWMYPALGALVLVFTVVAASRIAQLQWQRRSKKTRFL